MSDFKVSKDFDELGDLINKAADKFASKSEVVKAFQKEIDDTLETAQWLRFAEAFIAGSGGQVMDEFNEFEENAWRKATGICADFADAMVAIAKERGRL